ncbi:hypothetical protein JCM8202_005056 [Rhodotorula sphaerocarpa]
MDHESMLSSSRASARRSTRGSKREPIPAQHENAAAKVDPWAAISESLLQARAQARAPSAQSVRSFRTQDSRAPRRRAGDRPDPDATSEAGFSFASSFDESAKSEKYAWWTAVVAVVFIKWCIGFGGYSGRADPPMRGDFEAQRHWIALTSSSAASSARHDPPSPSSALQIAPSEWYFHDLSYWGLDYPPLTAYHSMLLGYIARVSASTAKFVTLRPPLASASLVDLQSWEANMQVLESAGDLKLWMRASVIIGDVLVWLSAVLRFCKRNVHGDERHGRRQKRALFAFLAIGLQPSLLLIDNGHFQYNSIMLGLTLWAVNFFQDGRDVLGGIFFVLALSFKQMALYYAPVVFAFLLGKCFWLGGADGVTLFANLGFAVIATFIAVLAPFLSSSRVLFQVAYRIFPFARGIFEDKVANFWCMLNVVIKLRPLFTASSLARLAALLTITAVLPVMLVLIGTSFALGRRRAEGASSPPPAAVPTLALLPRSLFASAMAFFLFSFQVHEKSILLPLMPLTVLMACRDSPQGKVDWDWAVLLNNVATFSMWPLLRRDGLALQYFVLLAAWNLVIGHDPRRASGRSIRLFTITVYTIAVALHLLEFVAVPPSHLPDLFVVLNQGLSGLVFGIAWLWTNQRLLQDSWALLGVGQGDEVKRR